MNSEPPPPPWQQIDSSSESQETITQETTNEFVNDTGITLDDLIIEPKGSLWGDATCSLTKCS